MNAKPQSPEPAGASLVVILAVSAAVAAAVGYGYYRKQQTDCEQVARAQLDAVADGKTVQINRWRKQLREEAEWILEASAVAASVRDYFAEPPSAGAGTYLRTWLNAWTKQRRYRRVLLLDSTLQVRLAAPEQESRIDPTARSSLQEALRSQAVQVSELHVDTVTKGSHLEVCIPLRSPSDGTTADQAGGVLLFEVDPAPFLFADLQMWPSPSLTAETLLVRREGEEVVCLNQVRGQDDAAQQLRFPLTRRSNPAVRAVLGEEGVVAGYDHHGEPVLAAIRRIPDSSWFVVVKQDEAEIQAPLRDQALTAGSVAGLLVLATSLAWMLAGYRRAHRLPRQRLDQDGLLAAGEARLRIALELAQAAEWELNLSDHCFDRSLPHDRIFGYESLLPKWDFEAVLRHVAEADRDLVDTKLRAALETPTDWRLECRIVRSDGTPGWIMVAGRPRPDAAGRIQHHVGVVQDITALRQATQSRAESEDHYRTLVESLPQLFWTCLPDGSCDYLSPQWVNYTGVAAREQLGEGWFQRLHPEDRPRVQAEWTGSVKGKRLFDTEFRIRRVDGVYRWFRTRALLLRNLKGQAIKWFGTCTDIEDRKQAEDSLQRSQQHLTLHIQQTPLAVIEWDTRFRVTGWNPAAERIFGFTAEDACGRHTDQLIVPTSGRARMAEVWSALLEGKGGESGVHENITKDGRTILCEWFNTPLMDADGRVMAVASLAVDVTERKQHEEFRELLVGELESKNAELEGLIHVASHDLRAPLVNVQGFSRRLEKACDELFVLVRDPEFPVPFRERVGRIIEDQIPKSLSFIRSGVSKMDALINGLLRVSRLGRVALNLERLDMNQLIREVLAVQAFQVQSSGAEIRVDDLPECQGDAGLVNQVFSNLLDNALKYRDPVRPLQIHFSGRVEGRQAIYCVADTGLGIASEHREKIWEMFHRLNPDGQVPGEGLGLNLVRRILDRHHGRVWVESVPGEGSRFLLSLPAD
jgi:PAS domain S-box-containing protein